MKSRKFIAGLLLALVAIGPAWAGSMMLLGAGKVGTTASPITTPIIMDGPAGLGPSTSVINYIGMYGGNNVTAWQTQALRRVQWPIAGSITGLTVSYPSGAGAAGNYTISLVKNGTLSSNVTCLIGNSQSSCTSSGTETIAAGDTLQWQSCPGTVSGTCTTGGTNTSNAQVQISATFTSSAANESIILSMGSTSAVSNTAANYASFGGYLGYNATESVASTPMPTGGTIDKLYIQNNDNPPGSSKFWIATLFKNGSATSLQCSITGTVTGSGVTYCNDTNAGHAVSVSAGDTISVEYCPQSSSSYVTSCSPGGTPATATFQASARFVPTISGEAVMLNAGAAAIPFNNGTQYLPLNGGMGQSGTESQVQGLSPGSFTVKKLSVVVAPAPGGSASRTITLRSGAASVGTPGNVSCVLTSALTSCSDTTNTYSTSSNALLNWMSTIGSGPAATTTAFKISYVVTVP